MLLPTDGYPTAVERSQEVALTMIIGYKQTSQALVPQKIAAESGIFKCTWRPAVLHPYPQCKKVS